ncbi:IBR domain, partial [Trinorchestia longiramus]
MEECPICCLNMPSKMMSGLWCGHRFCTSCWSEYISTKVVDEGTGQSITCAGFDCSVVVEDSIVMSLLKDHKVRLAYQHRISQSFVECNRQLRWCPYPDCKYVVKVQYPDARRVVCKCQNVFCFSCGASWHDPVKCSLLKKWIKKCDDDSETSNWISANTKVGLCGRFTMEQDRHYDSDSGNSSDDDDVGLEFDSEGEGIGAANRYNRDNEEFPYDVLSTEEVSQHMLECITDFNSVANIPHTTARLLLNHFRWDKEKLMERFYDSNQEKLFEEAHVAIPCKKKEDT